VGLPTDGYIRRWIFTAAATTALFPTPESAAPRASKCEIQSGRLRFKWLNTEPRDATAQMNHTLAAHQAESPSPFNRGSPVEILY
jgi:hypothetical protein